MGNILGLPAAGLGAVLIIVSLVLLRERIFQRARAAMVFTGVCLTGGLVHSILVALAKFASHWTDVLVGKLFGAGVGVTGILALVAVLLLAIDLHPRGNGAGRRTYWLAAFTAALLVAGVSTWSVLNGVPADVHTGVSTVTGG